MTHAVGTPEWARTWIRKYGWKNLDATTRANLRDMLNRGRTKRTASLRRAPKRRRGAKRSKAKRGRGLRRARARRRLRRRISRRKGR